MSNLYGIDLGGTKIEGAVLTTAPRLQQLFRERIPTQRERGYDHIVDAIGRMYERMVAATGETPKVVGIGTPGDLDPQTGLLRNSNTICLNERPLRADLEERLGVQVEMANDANCFALAEYHLGAVRHHYPEARLAFGVIMGTGVGGGLICDGQLWPGKHGIAGEWGHNFLAAAGGSCYCGRRGCVETILSGPSLEAFYRTRSGGYHKSLRSIVEQAGEKNHGPERATVERLLHYFGMALGSVINTLDPEVIVLGGGLGNIDLLYTRGREEVKKHIFNNRLETRVIKPVLGDSAGVFGAMLLAADSEQKQILRERYRDLTGG